MAFSVVALWLSILLDVYAMATGLEVLQDSWIHRTWHRRAPDVSVAVPCTTFAFAGALWYWGWAAATCVVVWTDLLTTLAWMKPNPQWLIKV